MSFQKQTFNRLWHTKHGRWSYCWILCYLCPRKPGTEPNEETKGINQVYITGPWVNHLTPWLIRIPRGPTVSFIRSTSCERFAHWVFKRLSSSGPADASRCYFILFISTLLPLRLYIWGIMKCVIYVYKWE